MLNRTANDALVAPATKGGDVSWQATDAVWELFDTKRPDCELKMMLAIAHHYNDAEECSRPGIETLARKCRCKKRWAVELRNRCIGSEDTFVIKKGGKGPRDSTWLGLAPKYVNWIRVHSRTTPISEAKGAVSCAKKGAVSSARKGAVPYREKCSRKYESKRKQAVAEPPPPLLDPEKHADFVRRLEDWRAKGRPLGEFPESDAALKANG